MSNYEIDKLTSNNGELDKSKKPELKKNNTYSEEEVDW